MEFNITASNIHRICTYRPDKDYTEDLKVAEKSLKEKVSKLLTDPYTPLDLEIYKITKGMIVDAKNFEDLQKKHLCNIEDPLPEGAKTYLQELWLRKEIGLELPPIDNVFALANGRLQEDAAIKLLGEHLNLDLSKNEDKGSKPNNTGYCDLEYLQDGVKIIRDTKVPENFQTFRSVTSVPSEYVWQLLDYLYLYDGKEGWIDYVLMPIHDDLIADYTKYMSERAKTAFFKNQDIIQRLSLHHRVKSMKLEIDISSSIDFLRSRIEKAKKYYEMITFEDCMNIQK